MSTDTRLCLICHGEGVIDDSHGIICRTCNGTGKLSVEWILSRMIPDTSTPFFPTIEAYDLVTLFVDTHHGEI